MTRPFQDSNMPNQNNLLAGLGLGPPRSHQVWNATKEKLIEQGYDLGPEPLGCGASAIVFPAQHRSSGKKVAVKIILDPSNERAIQQFVREQRVLASEYIPSDIVPKFVHSIDCDGIQPCLVMERIDGVGVLDFAKSHQLSVPQKIVLVERIFSAYRSLHDCNLVHGDPSHKNILIEPGSRVRLLDFGISRRANPGYDSIHSVVGPAGTPTFAPDSQLSGQVAASTQTDIQSIAALSYTLLTGEPKNEGPTFQNESIHRKQLLDALVPARIADIIVQAMREEQPTEEENRRLPITYRSCQSVIDAFENVRADAARVQARRRQAILATLMLVPLIAAFWWGYTQFLEVQRIQQQQTISLLQQEVTQIARQSHPAVATGIQSVQRNLDDYHQAEQSQDASRVQSARSQLVASMRKVLDLSRRLDRVIPIREALGIALEKMPWVDSSAAIQNSRDDLAKIYLDLGRHIDAGEVEDVDHRLGELQARLAELANNNALAQSADRSRAGFQSQRNEVPHRIAEQAPFNAVAVLAESAEGAWQSGDFKHSIALYQQASQKLEEVLPKLETPEESKARFERRTSRLGEEVMALRQQVEETKSQRDASERKTRELESRIATISSQASVDRETAAQAQQEAIRHRTEREGITSELAAAKATLESKLPDADAYSKLKPLYDQTAANLKDANAKIAAMERERTLLKAHPETPGNASSLSQNIQQLNDIQRQIDALDQTDRKAALDALRNAFAAYSKVDRERRNALREFRDTAPTVKAIDARLTECTALLTQALQSFDRAQGAIYSKLETQIEALRSERTRRLDVDGLLETSAAIKSIDEQGKRLTQEKSKYTESHQRISSGTAKLDMAETVRKILGASLVDSGNAGDLLVVQIANLDVHFRYCPPCEQGTFLMGSPDSESDRSSDEKQVSVWFDRGFYVMETECTNGLWNAVMSDKKGDATQTTLPVVNISHDDCLRFVTTANQKIGLTEVADARLRLPTEAEWEYACRAGTKTRFAFGDNESLLGDYAWFSGNSGSSLHPVGTKKANPWGLKDMHGSVWEWTADWYAQKLAGGKNPTGPSSGSIRVNRGGCYGFNSGSCRSANRFFHSPVDRNDDLGFRLALEFSPDK